MCEGMEVGARDGEDGVVGERHFCRSVKVTILRCLDFVWEHAAYTDAQD